MRKVVFYLIIIAGFSSCRIFNPNLMFKTPRGYKFSDVSDTLSKQEYRISPNDIIDLRLYANDGFKLIDVTSVGSTNDLSANNVNRSLSTNYLVQKDGNAKLPILGWTHVQGLTVRQAELMLEEKYAEIYNKPFILLKVINKRVMVFPGAGGSGKVLTLQNNNTTLIEGLAEVGGITADGKAYKIKLIRRSGLQPEVYRIDLSTIAGLKDGNIILQANDIIYVEPRRKITQSIASELAPFFTILSSAILVYTIVVIRK